MSIFDLQDTSLPPVCFICESWLSLDYPPFKCFITQSVTKPNELLQFGNLWRLHLSNSIQYENVWTSLFNRYDKILFNAIILCVCYICLVIMNV